MPTRHDHNYVAWLPRPSDVLLRSRPLAALVSLLAVLLSVLAGTAHGLLLVVDEPVSGALRQGELFPVLRWITDAGSPTSAALVGLVAAAALWPLCRAFALAVPMTVAAGIAADVLLKVLVSRPRPPDAVIGTALGSFPSGHVIQATLVFGLLIPALYLVTGRVVAFWLGVALFTVVVGGVSLSRVALGAHWPTDVLGSFFIGGALLLSAEYLVGSRWARDRCGSCRLHAPRPAARGSRTR